MYSKNMKGAALGFGILLSGILAFSSTSQASILHQAYYIDGGSYAGNQDFGGSLGMDFDVTGNHIKISALGFFDSAIDGIQGTNTTINVGIFDRNGSSTTALASTSFSFGDDGTEMGGYRFKDIATLFLNQGFEGTVLAWGFNDTDENGNVAGGMPASTVVPDLAGILHVGTRFNGTPGDASAGTVIPPAVFGNGCSGAGNTCFAAGSFKYKVSEPGTLAIMGLGLIGLGIARRKRAA